MFLGPVVLLVPLLASFAVSEYTPDVEISTGTIRGEIFTTINSVKYAAFKGIQYAEHPVGKLRFKAPVPVKPWTETRLANNEGQGCPQINPEGKVVGSESCLSLNVFTTEINFDENPAELKAVMVWFHEGSFTHGSGNTNNRRPDFLLERGVVFVSLNYRLGALGFLNLNLAAAAGNQGLKDQNLALQWVKTNIEKFGGNPEMVTIFGKGAGAASVGYHVLSEASAGLFHRAISMSGTPLSPRSFVPQEVAIRRSQKLGALIQGKMSALRTTKQLLKKLRTVSIRQLLVQSLSIDLTSPFVPTIEKKKKSTKAFLSKCTVDKYLDGEFNKVPHLMGFVKGETLPYAHQTAGLVRLIEKTHNFITVMTKKMPTVLPTLKKVAKILKAGKGDVPEALVESAEEIATDMMLNLPIHETQRLLFEKNEDNPIYYYEITADTDDIPYIFRIRTKDYNLSTDSSSGRTIDRISTMWTNFAKHGNPTPDGEDKGSVNITWPKSESHGPALELGEELRIISKPVSNLVGTMQHIYSIKIRYLIGC